jgi:hypothetical protein
MKQVSTERRADCVDLDLDPKLVEAVEAYNNDAVHGALSAGCCGVQPERVDEAGLIHFKVEGCEGAQFDPMADFRAATYFNRLPGFKAGRSSIGRFWVQVGDWAVDGGGVSEKQCVSCFDDLPDLTRKELLKTARVQG